MEKQSKIKVALITGSTKGLGLEVAKRLSEVGYKIILTGRTKETFVNAKNQLRNPCNHELFCGDLLKKEFLTSLCHLPFLPDIVVHSLGGKIEGDEQPLNANILMESVELNLGIAANINAHYLPLMKNRGYGRIIHISSNASETGNSAPGYAASKSAVNAYVKSTARFYAKNNVMLCAVLPSIFLYPDSSWDIKRKTEPEHYQKRLLEMPLGRFLSPEEIAETVTDIAISDSMAYSGSLIQLTGSSS